MDANKVILKDEYRFDSDDSSKNAKFTLFKTEDKDNLFFEDDDQSKLYTLHYLV